MSRPERAALIALVLVAWVPSGQATEAPSFGEPLAPGDVAGMVAVAPDGSGLPPGQGTPNEGRAVYAGSCVACHGERLQGVPAADGPALVGGRGTLASAKPVKTVESYWPYATTLFDYVKRAMPFNAPGSLSDPEVYAVVAFILAEGKVVGRDATMDARTLPLVRMPNADGFVSDPRPPAPPGLRLPN